MRRILFTLLLLASAAQAQSFLGKKIIDLTYSFNDKTIYWPTNETFTHKKTAWGINEKGYWYSSADISGSEHGGTHLDAPIHFSEKGWTSDLIPVDRFTGAVFVIDVSESCKNNPDYTMQISDIERFEKKNGKIAENAIVLMRSGWGKYWPDKKKYIGNDKPGDTSNLHFPGISKEAAEYLVKEKRIKGFGLDTASMDPGTSQDFMAHRIFGAADVYGLENVANLEQVPDKGAMLIALPMKIQDGTGGPVRIIALLP